MSRGLDVKQCREKYFRSVKTSPFCEKASCVCVIVEARRMIILQAERLTLLFGRELTVDDAEDGTQKTARNRQQTG